MKTVAKFEINYIQYLNEQAELIEALPSFAENPENLLPLYRLMTLCRSFDNKAVTMQRTGKIGTYAGILGQEAISVTLGAVMQHDDVLCADYRQHGAFLQRGTTLTHLFTYWGGNEQGSYVDHPHDFPMSVPIATQCLHAAGVATAIKLRKQPRVAVSVCGDGATSEGNFYEAINVAGDWNLPLVFLVNNNQWAISVPRKAQTHSETLAQKAIAAGFEGIQVDGNDVIALHKVISDSLAKARAGEGPTLIEAITYRICDHTTADDAKRYRSDEEVKQAWKKEPIARLRNYLMHINAWSEQEEQQLIAECDEQVEQAVKDYMNSKPQPATAMFDYLYETWPKAYEYQRNELIKKCRVG